jgi:hypothetical protein
LNSEKAATDLLETRSSIYSDGCGCLLAASTSLAARLITNAFQTSTGGLDRIVKSPDSNIRFVSTYVCGLDTGKWVLTFFPYGKKWRTWHKAFSPHMQPNIARQYHPIELKAARRLLWNLFDTPEDFMQHLR